MALVSKIGVNISADLTGAAGLASVAAPLSVRRTVELASGVGIDQADAVYSQQATILTAATLTLDLKGSLEDALGAAFTPAKLKAIYIGSSVNNTTLLTILGNAAAVPILNTVATTITLGPGGVFLMVQPSLAAIAVTAATGDIIQIVNAAGASAIVDIVLIGTSA